MSLKLLVKTLEGGKILVPVLQDFISAQNRQLNKGIITREEITLHDCELTIKAMKRRIAEFGTVIKRDKDFFHPSALGSCMRALWYSYFGAKPEFKMKDDELRGYLILEIGSYFHLLLQNLFQRAGILVKREMVIVDKINRILGHCDAVIKLQGKKYVVEIKTINARNFTLLGNQPKMAHLQQAHAYMKSLDLKWAIILYYDKDRSNMREFVIPFSDKFYEEYCEARITKYFRKIKQKKLPDREGFGPAKFPCSFCGHASLCYSQEATNKFVKKVQTYEDTDEEGEAYFRIQRRLKKWMAYEFKVGY